MKKFIATSFSLALAFSALCAGPSILRVDASRVMDVPECGHFRMGSPGNPKIEFNSRYMTIGGRPFLPVMGEMHFSRIVPSQWEDRILKMKACGVNVIATYLFWNHHEEIEGEFDWEDGKNLREFVRLCARHGMYVVPRLGPWSHGEARNGGTPDWLLDKKYMKDRSNDPVYQQYVDRYFRQIGRQLEGLYYKDGGNVIGIQLENEYWHGREGEAHIQWLKDKALECGIDVPLYTVTGWGDGSVPPLEVIPLWGAYADAPWVEHVGKEYQPENFVFNPFRDNEKIGNDRVKNEDEYMTYERYPFFTCEIGMGVQNTYHRRLYIDPIDGLGLIMARLGAGSNLLGYYIFTGATQTAGKLWSTEEEQVKTGYWSRVPVKSYDFQAAIRESGELAPSYMKLKKLHYLINGRGDEIAPMAAVTPKLPMDGLQYAVRSDNTKGYLFGINYTRYFPKKNQGKVKFDIRLDGARLSFPEAGFEPEDSTIFVWPLRIDFDGMKVNYATAQPLADVDGCLVFFRNRNIPVEFSLDKSAVTSVETDATVISTAGAWIVKDIRPSRHKAFEAVLTDGTRRQVIVLSDDDADAFWLFGNRAYISRDAMYDNNGDIFMLSDRPVASYARLDRATVSFEERTENFPTAGNGITVSSKGLFDDARWLETAGMDSIDAYKERYHRFFFKEFGLNDPSGIKKATLYLYSPSECEINLNDTWVNTTVAPGRLNEIDITGYARRGNNMLFLSFPYETGSRPFAARIIVEHYNYDRIDFSTDRSWLTTDYYTNPALNRWFPTPGEATVVPAPACASSLATPAFSQWTVSVPSDVFDGPVNNVVMHINYNGDRAELYNGHFLTDDNFNNHDLWRIGLCRQEHSVAGRDLTLNIYPLRPSTKVFIDLPANGDDAVPAINSVDVTYEYIKKIE